MKTIDEISKIKATILYILKSFPDGIDYIKLFKIMYFAQQEHLVKYGKPIFNDTFHALKHGPVPSFSYKCFQILEKDASFPNEELKTFANSFNINRETKMIYMKEEPDMDELSKVNIKSLDSVIDKYGNYNSHKLSEISHDEAWLNAYKRTKDDPEYDRISVIEIAKAGNAGNDIIKYIRKKEQLKKALSF